MYNYCILVGRVVKDFEKFEYEKGNYTKMLLAVNRPFKNNKTDTYDSDLFQITLWDQLCDIAVSNLSKGSLIMVKGRLQTSKLELDKGSMNIPEIIAERLIFLAPPSEKK